MCTSNSDDRKLENTVKQSRFKHFGELHKEWSEAGVSASRVTTLRCLQEKGYQATSETETIVRSILTGLRRKITGLLLNGPKSSFQIKVKVHFAFHLEIKVWRKSGEAQNPSCLKSSVTFLKSGMIWGDVCWCWSIVFYQVQSQCSHLPGDFRALYASIWKYFKLKIEMFIIVGAERLRAHIQHKHSSCK